MEAFGIMKIGSTICEYCGNKIDWFYQMPTKASEGKITITKTPEGRVALLKKPQLVDEGRYVMTCRCNECRKRNSFYYYE